MTALTAEQHGDALWSIEQRQNGFFIINNRTGATENGWPLPSMDRAIEWMKVLLMVHTRTPEQVKADEAEATAWMRALDRRDGNLRAMDDDQDFDPSAEIQFDRDRGDTWQ